MPDRVRDEVVERLAQTDGIGLDADCPLTDHRANVRSQQGARVCRLTRDAADLDVLEPDGRDCGVSDHALDPTAGGDDELGKRPPLARVDRGLSVDGRDRGERGDRAPQLVHEHGKTVEAAPARHATDRSAMRASAQRAVSLSISSSSSA